MIFDITIYDPATGAILREASGPAFDLLMLNVQPGEAWIAGTYSEAQCHIVDGQPVLKPPKPSGQYWIFDDAAGHWIDPRTPADHQAALYAARSAAQRDKSGLLMDLRLMGVLTAQEAMQAALGVIPPSFEAALSSLPEDAQEMARIKWAGDQTISRMNPLILLAAYAKGITDEQLDAAFCVQTPT